MQQSHAGDAVRGRHVPRRRLLLFFAAAVVLLLALPAAAHAASLTYTVAPTAVPYGSAVTVDGIVDPVAAGQEVIVALDGVDVTTVLTDDASHFQATVTPAKGAVLTARLADGTLGPEIPISVRPLASLTVLSKSVFGSAVMTVKVRPGTWTGPATATVGHNNKIVARVSFTVQSSVQRFRVPLPGVGRFTVRVTLPAANGLLAKTTATTFSVSGPRVATGSSGPAVRALLTQLRRLRFRIPGIASTLSRNAADSIMAFQKAYGLPRTYVFDADDWRKLDVARLIKARYATPATHIEIDKRRQILMVVKGGTPYGILCVSTGATGNTPEGRHSIMWKAYAGFTPYGNTYLYWDMQFYPGFAMHAYPFVPPYPASHGCVREPNWVAPWTYYQSFVGETVYVYH